MGDKPATLKRRSIRLKGYDYAHPGLYFVTICAHEKRCFFGRIEDSGVQLTHLGRIVRECWLEIPTHFPRVGLEAFVVMPNHLHGILAICRSWQHPTSQGMTQKGPPGSCPHVTPDSLAAVIRSFKAAVSKRARNACEGTAGTIWQRNYYERVLRNGREFTSATRYILENPSRWELDAENPNAKTKS